jgi:hypothetical protein
LDGPGCKIKGKTCPVVLVIVPRPEKVKWIQFLLIFGILLVGVKLSC